ncbi:MAG: PH domain-containing protein [Flavobacterium sp.]|nr:PH domain-containing protein [Flavobacterium sp.]
MIDNLKKILNEDQDPVAIEKISAKLNNLLMKNEEIGYIAVQKKPAITLFPDSIVVTNKRIIICKPKNLGLSMEFIDYDWDDVTASFVKENLLGAEFSFSTKSDLSLSIDYLPKNQARKLYTYAKEQLDILKNGVETSVDNEILETLNTAVFENIEEIATEEVVNYAEIMPVTATNYEPFIENEPSENVNSTDNSLLKLTQEQLFDKLQNYKKLLVNGLIMQGEYDNFKKEILKLM